MKRFYKWVSSAWPLWGTLLVIGVHQGLLTSLPSKTESINESLSIGLQVIGGLLVLHSIDSSLGLLRGESIPRVIIQWFRTCPVWSKRKVVEARMSATLDITASFQGRVKRQANSLSERVTELELQMEEMHQDIVKRERAILKLVSDTKEELSARAGSNEVELRDIKAKVDGTVLGSIKQQAFGVVIAVYGAGLGYFS